LTTDVCSKGIRTACREGLCQRPFTRLLCHVRRWLPALSELRNLRRLVAVMWNNDEKRKTRPPTQPLFDFKLVVYLRNRK
jgi:hypothetical protein